MMLLPPAKDTCPICGTKHEAHLPHNAQSIYYQYHFYGIRGRWPTWADAVAHCTPKMRAFWEGELRLKNAWTEPADGQLIADPPAESINQPIGSISTPTFGPEEE